MIGSRYYVKRWAFRLTGQGSFRRNVSDVPVLRNNKTSGIFLMRNINNLSLKSKEK